MIGKNVKITRYEEDSTYDGPQVNVPRTPYHVDYTPRKVNKELKFLSRVGQKLKFIGQDFLTWQ